MIFICYPKCTTCQKAQKWLDSHTIKYDLRDIKQNNPAYEELKGWYITSGLPVKRFLGLKDKLPNMTEEECLKLLATDGMLVKRPLLVDDDFVLVGFKEAEWESKVL